MQIAGSVALIICSIVILKQMNFISNKSIGLDKNVIEVRIPESYADKASVFRDDLLKDKSVDCISIVTASPVLEHFMLALRYEDNGAEKEYSPSGFTGDANYLKVMGIKLIRGEDFSQLQSPGGKKCLINETFYKMFRDRDLIGKSVPGMEDMTILGVTEDFNYNDLKSKVEPAFIAFSTKGSHLLVKPLPGQLMAARKKISQVWDQLIPDYPLNIESVGDRFEWFHRDNRNFIKLIMSCAFISILLSMIGLFAVSLQTSLNRTKEIGIRKINGAGIAEILAILNKDLLRWLLMAIVIASPLALFAMNKWLENFAYKTRFAWWIVALAGIITILISLLTVSWHSLRAAVRNPVETLRYE
jgi:putative ABC transport system permease protein